MKRNTDNGIKPLLKKLFPRMILMNIPVWLVTLIWGFDITMIVGLAVGTVYAIIGNMYLAETIDRAVGTSTSKAKAMMLGCYTARMLGLGILGYMALSFDFMNFAGVLLPQFYARIVLTVMQFSEKKK